MWNELTFLWNELTILWNDLTIDWNDLTWNDLTMERNDRIPLAKTAKFATAQNQLNKQKCVFLVNHLL